MKKLLTVLFLSIFLSVSAFSQGDDLEKRRAEFNGTWVWDKNSSRNGFDRKLFDQYLLYITFKDNKFNITKVFVAGKKAANYGISLVTDKSGEKNNYTGYQGNMERNSKTRWENAMLISEFRNHSEDKKHTYGGIEKYWLSKDGNTLYFETTQTYPAVPMIVEDWVNPKLIFRRKK